MFKEKIFQSEQQGLDISKNSELNEIQHESEQSSLKKNQLQQNPIIIRIPFHVMSQQKLRKVLPNSIIGKIHDKETSINLSINSNDPNAFNVNLYKKKVIRPVQLLKVRKLIHKKTRKIIKVVKSAENVDVLYDYEEMGDFINTSGSESLYQKKKYSLQQEDILTQIKQYLSIKIHSKEGQIQLDAAQTDKYLKLIQPISFLKSYNFVPPLCDMLMNKIKPRSQQSSHIVSKSINFEEELPAPHSVEIPKFISQSQLFRRISVFLEKRPCWLKNTLYYTLFQEGMKDKFTITDFKNVMKFSAYTYRNGPWKHTFCRFGFDPRRQSKSIIYQSMLIKIKQKQAEDYENQVEEQVYDPTFQQISNRFIRSYQLCDIDNQTIRQIVQGKLISTQGECTKQHGWLNSTEHGKIIKIMKMKVQQSNQNNV